MKRRKNNKLILLLVLLLAISIGFALLSTVLKVDGIANILKPTWSIYWTNPQVTQGSVSQTLPTIGEDEGDPENTKVSWTVTLASPKDYYEFTIDAVNDGSLDAMIASTELVLKDEDGHVIDIPDYLIHKITYDDFTEINNNDLLASETSQKFRIKVYYDLDKMSAAVLNSFPDDGITYNFSYKINYTLTNEDVIKPELRLGEYFTLDPDLENATTDYEGFSGSTPTIDQNLWRVIKINRDGTVDAISHYVSTNNITISGIDGYKNYVAGLQEIASCYAKEGYTIGTRMMGYNGQTGVLPDTYYLNGAINKYPSTTSSPIPTTGIGEEIEDGLLGDTLYLKDYLLVKDVYGDIRATKKGSTSNFTYFVSSRRYYYRSSDNYFSFCLRYATTSGNNIDDTRIRYYNGSWGNNSLSYSVRPIITLKNTIKIDSGEGSLTEPYTLSE